MVIPQWRSQDRIPARQCHLAEHPGTGHTHPLRSALGGQFRLVDVDGQIVSEFQQGIITVPTTQAANLSAASRLSGMAAQPVQDGMCVLV